MSTSSFTGTIKNFSPKPDEGYYGIFVDNGQEEKWLNGQGDPEDSWSKGDKVKIKANMDEFIEIQEIDVMEDGESDEGSASKQSAPKTQGDKPSSNHSSKDDRINKKVAFKEACETARELDLLENKVENGEHMEDVSKIANGYYNILKSMGDE